MCSKVSQRLSKILGRESLADCQGYPETAIELAKLPRRHRIKGTL